MIFNNTDGEKYTNISFTESGTEYAQMRASKEEFAIYHNTGILKMNGNTVLHASNYADYAVPKTGGTINGVLTINKDTSSGYRTLVLNNPNTEQSGHLNLISFKHNSTEYSYLTVGLEGWTFCHNKGHLHFSSDGTGTGIALHNRTGLDIGTSKYKWNNVYANNFIGNLTGTADKSTYSDILITNSRNFTAANDRLNVKSGVRFYANIYNNSGVAGDWGFPSSSNNSNGVLVLQVDTVDSEPLNGRTSHVLGLSSNGNIYHKHKNNDSTSWYKIVEAKGASDQFIKGDGTLDSTEYATKEDVKDSGTYWEYL